MTHHQRFLQAIRPTFAPAVEVWNEQHGRGPLVVEPLLRGYAKHLCNALTPQDWRHFSLEVIATYSGVDVWWVVLRINGARRWRVRLRLCDGARSPDLTIFDDTVDVYAIARWR